MKSFNKFLSFVVCLMLGCNSNPVQNVRSITLLIDKTDPAPGPKAADITDQLRLNENLWQGMTIKIASISDRDLNDSKSIVLQPEDKWTNNITIRQAEINHFTKELGTALNEGNPTKALDHSIIYRNILNELNALSTSQAKERYLAIYSDLMENSDIDFYKGDTFQLLRKSPNKITKQLEQSGQLPNLSGIEIWLIYSPQTYEANNTYMVVARFYKHLLESHGATVHIEHSFNLGQ